MPDSEINDPLLRYSFEADRKIRVGFVGCGGQAFRNLLPCFQYAPIELVATCDIQIERARAYARQFGATNAYADHREMLARERLDAVFFASGYGDDHRPLYPAHAADALGAGCHAWIEKPPAASCAEIETLHELSRKTGKQVGVGLMKMFSPGIRKARDIMRSAQFGRPTSFMLRDPEKLPVAKDRGDLGKMRWLLDHLPHPMSIIHTLLGPARRLQVAEGNDGSAVLTFNMVNGAVGVLLMPWGMPRTVPSERLEVYGDGAAVFLDNNTELTYFRSGHPGTGDFVYGRVSEYIGRDEHAPLHWRMDAYSGQPYNMHLFYQGYAPAIIYFVSCILAGRTVAVGGLDDAWYITRYFEILRTIGSAAVELEAGPEWVRGAVSD